MVSPIKESRSFSRTTRARTMLATYSNSASSGLRSSKNVSCRNGRKSSISWKMSTIKKSKGYWNMEKMQLDLRMLSLTQSDYCWERPRKTLKRIERRRKYKLKIIITSKNWRVVLSWHMGNPFSFCISLVANIWRWILIWCPKSLGAATCSLRKQQKKAGSPCNQSNLR